MSAQTAIARKRIFASIVVGLLTLLSLGHAVASGRVIVLGIDESGSYSFWPRGIDLARGVINDLQPGDVLYLRRINAESYLEKSSMLRVAMPQLPERPANAFDRTRKMEYQRALQGLIQIKAQATQTLAGLKPSRASRTDVWGFIAAAQERIVHERSANARFIILVSDMVDNCRFDSPISLEGSRVIVAGFQSQADPAATQKLQALWRDRLLNKKATGVEFLPADMPLNIAKR